MTAILLTWLKHLKQNEQTNWRILAFLQVCQGVQNYFHCLTQFLLNEVLKKESNMIAKSVHLTNSHMTIYTTVAFI